MKALEKLRKISELFGPSGIDAPEKEAELLIRHGLNLDMVTLYRENPELDEKQAHAIEAMVNRRSGREPLQYITGCTGFAGLKILVGGGVLIPRPETELMAEYAARITAQRAGRMAQSATDNRQQVAILDLCTGSGCLALALAKEFRDAMVYGTDISEKALSYAEKNAHLNDINNITFLRGHLFEPFSADIPDRLFDLIISNPPYIRSGDIETLQPEIRDWEPQIALDGGAEGLDYYREIIPAARMFLKDGGMLMFELGEGCAGDVLNIMKDIGYLKIEVQRDYAGIERIIQAIWTR